ncbi:hypothetical protein D3C81_1492790 [compost metagenome]
MLVGVQIQRGKGKRQVGGAGKIELGARHIAHHVRVVQRLPVLVQVFMHAVMGIAVDERIEARRECGIVRDVASLQVLQLLHVGDASLHLQVAASGETVGKLQQQTLQGQGGTPARHGVIAERNDAARFQIARDEVDDMLAVLPVDPGVDAVQGNEVELRQIGHVALGQFFEAVFQQGQIA